MNSQAKLRPRVDRLPRFHASAAAMAAMLVAACGATVLAQPLRFEAEAGTLVNVVTSSSIPGYSGWGYVTGFSNQDAVPDYVELQVEAAAGLYELYVGYRSPYGPKQFDFRVNQQYGSGTFPQSSTFSSVRAGLVAVEGGPATLGIYEGWAFYDLDYLELRPYIPPVIAPVPPLLVDSQADENTQVLMNYLASQYGRNTLAGQHHQESRNLPFPGDAYLAKSGGLTPAVRSSDFMDYSPTRRQFGANPNQETEQAISWAQSTGGIVSMMWHWNAPANLINQPGQEWWRGFYSNATTFDLPAAFANPGGANYQLLLRDIDAIAVELQKFEDAGVPVIWHPLHEAQGGWFWWGDHGSEAFKSLWRLMHDRLTDHHGLHNLIWEYSMATSAGAAFDPAWYPGDDVVDLVGLDIYTDQGATMGGPWIDALAQFNGRKMIALSETGALPDPTDLELWDIGWSYFSPWKGEFIDQATAEDLQAILGAEGVVTLDELPALPWRLAGGYQGADLNFDGRVDDRDLLAWAAAFGNGVADGADFLLWQRQYVGGEQFTVGAAEPSTAALLPPAALFYALAARRRR